MNLIIIKQFGAHLFIVVLTYTVFKGKVASNFYLDVGTMFISATIIQASIIS